MEEIYLISIDPGSNIGITVYGLNPVSLEITSIETILITLDNYVDPDDKENRMLEKLVVISDTCEWLVKKYNPHALIAEAAFVSRFPKAVMQLSQYIAALELTFIKANPNIKFFRYPPKYIKKYIGAGGNAGKDDMTAALRKIPEITKFIVPEVLTEHEVDAIAIGYVGITEIREYPHILYT